MTYQSYEQAWSYVAAFAGDPNVAILDWRAIHDVDKGVKAETFRGTLPQCWQTLCAWNNAGYGIFAVVAALDGVGRELANVSYIRAHYVDLDNLSSQQNYERAAAAYPAPSFAVHSSVVYDDQGQPSRSKYHVYWPVQPYQSNDYFQLIQRKLRQVFDGDKRIIDATRVMRVPGTIHLKEPSRPHLVTMHALPGYGQWHDVSALGDALASVNVIDGGVGTRHELGDPDLAAPDLSWIDRALTLCDPNTLDRGEWIAITAAIKQAGWSVTDPQTLLDRWLAWCARYENNDPAENIKQWRNIRNTELGWPSLLRRIPSLQAQITFGGVEHPAAQANPAGVPVATADGTTPPMPVPPPLDCSGEYLTHLEQAEWFKGCVYIENMGRMMTAKGRFMKPEQFNVAFGGKKFIIDTTGKMVNEAWQAATRSTLWTVPKVDHTRFIPHAPYQDIVMDVLGRDGVNVFKAPQVRAIQGDPSPFLNHIAALLPLPGDQRVLLDFLAHNARFPGHKIPWAPVIQSAEGAGKGVLKAIMTHLMGLPYVHFPNAKELTNSGSQFNAWMRHKLFLLADEVKVDDRRDLIEVLKPMISEKLIEVQGKGNDQELEDNFANWLFFTNWKDAIPVNKNGRRFCIMYSALQTAQDMLDRGMNEQYFDALYKWLEADGSAIVADYLLRYPIERGAIPMRAPITSSTAQAVDISRSPIERSIAEGVEDGAQGFRGGWVSSIMVAKRVKDTGAVRGGAVSPQVIGTVLETMGYVACGRAPREFFQEDRQRPYLYHYARQADVNGYGRAQGWE